MQIWKESLASMSDQRSVNSENEKILLTLGLCAKAGKLIFGVPMICEAMKKGGKNMPLIVLEASDASENTQKKISDKCKFYGVEHVRLCHDGERLASAVGKTAKLGAVAVTDKGLCLLIKKHI